MVEKFEKNDERYLEWVAAHQNGFVVNTDDPLSQDIYPMVHTARHKVISTPARRNYTTGKYIKYCSLDLAALDEYVQKQYGRAPHRCGTCMRKSAPANCSREIHHDAE